MKAIITAILFPAVLSAASLLPAVASGQGLEPLHLREVYVPHEEFLERANQDPDGVIMELAEYRSLVLKGVLESQKAPTLNLPPISAVVTQARHAGVLKGKTARFTSAIEIRVTRDGWVRCPLDPIPKAIGSVRVDGKPGWLLRQAPVASKKKAPTPLSFLLLKGKGVHKVELSFSLRVIETDDFSQIRGVLPRAESGTLQLEVPGYTEATSTPPNLLTETLQATQSSRFNLSLDSSSSFSIVWKMKRAAGKNSSELSALNGMTILPRLRAPLFAWNSRIWVQRSKTETLEFIEPAGTRVVTVKGDNVHSWTRQGQSISVLLKEPTIGLVDIRFDGILTGENVDEDPVPARRYLVGPPGLVGAYSSSGYLAVCETNPEHYDLTPQAASEVSLEDASFPSIDNYSASRCFSYTSETARLEFTARQRDRAFEYRSAGLVQVLEGGVTLDAIYHIDVTRGSEYRFVASIPEPWDIVSLQAVGAKGQAVRVPRWEIIPADEGRTVEIKFSRSINVSSPLVLSMRLQHLDFQPDISWPERILEFSLPHFFGSEKSKNEIGVKLPDSMFAVIPDLPGWEALKSEALRRAGFTEAIDAETGLAAGLSSTTEGASLPISLTLKHRRPMGEYQALSHLLALEDRFRVRNDIRLAIVDRAIEELRFRLPISQEVHAPVMGEGIKEVVVEEDEGGGSVRIVRYAKPWTGRREIRIEYEALEGQLPSADNGQRVPWLKISGRADDPLAPVFDGDHQVVFQGLGATKIEARMGDELAGIDVDNLPELGQPWREGRVLFAFQFKSRSGPGLPDGATPSSFNIIKFDRAEVLGIISREMALTTVIDPSGVSRTYLEAVVAYNRNHQQLEIQLPEGATILSARIGNAPAPYVRKSEKTGYWQLPLPPRSYSKISLIYKRDTSLGRWGTWSERGPVFVGVPVISTTWKTYHPKGFRFHISGGNLQGADPSPLPRTFFDLAFNAIATRRVPPHGLLDDETEARPYFSGAYLSGNESSPGSEDKPGNQPAINSPDRLEIAPENIGPGLATNKKDHSLVLPMHIGGHLIETSKLGGEPLLSLGYRSLPWWKFSKRTTFLLALVIGLLIAVRRGASFYWRYAVGGLLAGAFLSDIGSSLAGWESPFLLIPACEAFIGLIIIGLLRESIKRTATWIKTRKRPKAAAMATMVICLTTAGWAQGQDEILIPYETDSLGEKITEAKVYLPYDKFRALWLLANPEGDDTKGKPPADLVLGGGTYLLSIEGDTYRIKGSAPLLVLSDSWVSIPMPFPRGKLKSVLVDGKPVGVAQKDGTPFITLRGKGQRLIEVETTGPVTNRLGSYSIEARLLSGPAASLSATLPAGALPVAPGTPAGLTYQQGPENTTLEMDLGPSATMSLGWSFPRISGKQRARLESTSYTDLQLTLDGYNVLRSETINAAGVPATSVVYEILGDWKITSVSAAELSEWTVSTENDKRYLNVFFSSPAKKVAIEIKGWAPLTSGEEQQVAGLSLDGALRQASYIGVRHDARRRWNPEILSNQRASVDELLDDIKLPENRPDRLYQFLESLADQTVSAIPLAGTADAATTAVLYITQGATVIHARTRYQTGVEGPLRQELVLPPGWEFRNVEGETVSDWQVSQTDDGPRLIVLFSRRAKSGTQVTWSAQRIYTSPQEKIKVPLLRTITVAPQLRSETVRWSITAAEEVDLRVADGVAGIEKVARENEKLLVTLPSPSRRLFDMRSTGTSPSYNLELELGARTGQPTAEAVLFARAAEDFILVNGQVEITVTGGLQDTFFFRLPDGVTQTSLRTRNLRSLTSSEDGALKLTLTSGIVGKHTVALSYRISRTPGEADVVIKPFVLLGEDQAVADSDLWVGLVETSEVLLDAVTRGLEKAKVENLPYLPEGVASESIQQVFRATRGDDWDLTLKPVDLASSVTDDASVELVDLVTVIGADGTLRTKAVYTIKNKKLQFLRIDLPDETQLWGATLNGNPMVVSKGQEALQVPLKHVGRGDLDLEVGIVYAHSRKAALPILAGDLELEAPKVLGQSTASGALREGEVTVRRTLWRVELPEGYDGGLDDGNMQPVVSSIQYASKVESNIKDIEKLTQILKASEGTAGKPANLRQRRQAEISLKLLQQELSDNIMDLEESNASTVEDDEPLQVEQQAIVTQQQESRNALDSGKDKLKSLERTIKEATGADRRQLGQRDQAFQDSYNFKGNDWIRNTSPQQQKAPGFDIRIDLPHIQDLLYKTFFTGFRFTANPRKETDVEKTKEKAVNRSGLSPLPPSRINQVNPALESPPAPPGATSLTFRREGGEARLVLSLSRKGHLLRFVSPALLILAIAVFSWRLGRKPKTS